MTPESDPAATDQAATDPAPTDPDAAATFLALVRHRRTPEALERLEQDPALAGIRGPDGLSALMLAAYTRQPDLVDALLKAGGGPDVFEACALGDEDRVRVLVREDAQRIHATSPDGFTPLHLACHFGRKRLVGVILNLGADPLARSTNDMGNTPLHAAAAGGAAHVVRVLLAEAVPVDAPDAAGHTALHVACANGDTATASVLLDHGADPRAQDHEGHDAFAVARARDQDAVVELLKARDG